MLCLAPITVIQMQQAIANKKIPLLLIALLVVLSIAVLVYARAQMTLADAQSNNHTKHTAEQASNFATQAFNAKALTVNGGNANKTLQFPALNSINLPSEQDKSNGLPTTLTTQDWLSQAEQYEQQILTSRPPL